MNAVVGAKAGCSRCGRFERPWPVVRIRQTRITVCDGLEYERFGGLGIELEEGVDGVASNEERAH